MTRTAPHRFLRQLGAILLALATAGVAPAAAQHLSDSLRPVMARLDASAQVQNLFRTCPADGYRRARAEASARLPRPAGGTACAADPAACHDACVAGSGGACFALGRLFQRDEKTLPQRYAEMLFALSCGFGHAGGCTNRGSGIRNSRPDGDPFEGVAEAARDSCQFRTFRIACRLEDAWGCAMLGQSYGEGEGVARSASLARENYLKSCRIAPDFAACDFARERLGDRATGGWRR